MKYILLFSLFLTALTQASLFPKKHSAIKKIRSSKSVVTPVRFVENENRILHRGFAEYIDRLGKKSARVCRLLGQATTQEKYAAHALATLSND